MVLPRLGVAVVAVLAEPRSKRFVQAQDSPVVACHAARVATTGVGNVGLHAGAMKRCTVVVRGHKTNPPQAVSPWHHVPGGDDQPITDECAGTAKPAVVEATAYEPNAQDGSRNCHPSSFPKTHSSLAFRPLNRRNARDCSTAGRRGTYSTSAPLGAVAGVRDSGVGLREDGLGRHSLRFAPRPGALECLFDRYIGVAG